uniref:Uncharacterized protein n=1 Tax=Romanomermis culicivorax TaxID=13658 RepID=A0A915JY22_ROMCU
MENYLSTVDDVRSMVEKSILRVESLASCMALPSVSARTLVNNVTRRETMATTRFMADGKRQIDFVLVHEADRSRRRPWLHMKNRGSLFQSDGGQSMLLI